MPKGGSDTNFFDDSSSDEEIGFGGHKKAAKQSSSVSPNNNPDFDRLKMKPTPMAAASSSGSKNNKSKVGFSKIDVEPDNDRAYSDDDDLDLEEEFDGAAAGGALRDSDAEPDSGCRFLGMKCRTFLLTAVVVLLVLAVAAWQLNLLQDPAGTDAAYDNAAEAEYDESAGMINDNPGYNPADTTPPAAATPPPKKALPPKVTPPTVVAGATDAATVNEDTATPETEDGDDTGAGNAAGGVDPLDTLDDTDDTANANVDGANDKANGTPTDPMENGPPAAVAGTPDAGKTNDTLPDLKDTKAAPAVTGVADTKANNDTAGASSTPVADDPAEIEGEEAADAGLQAALAQEAARVKTAADAKRKQAGDSGLKPSEVEVEVIDGSAASATNSTQKPADEDDEKDDIVVSLEAEKKSPELTQEDAEATGRQPGQVLSGLKKNPLLDAIPTKGDLERLGSIVDAKTNQTRSVTLADVMGSGSGGDGVTILPSLSAIPPGSANLTLLIRQRLEGQPTMTYLNGLDYTQIRTDALPPFKIDPWILATSDDIPPALQQCRSASKAKKGKAGWYQKYIKKCQDQLEAVSTAAAAAAAAAKDKGVAGAQASKEKAVPLDVPSAEYLIYSCSTPSCTTGEGLSSHLLGLTYAFLLALASDRIFVVDWPVSLGAIEYATFKASQYMAWAPEFREASRPENYGVDVLNFRFEMVKDADLMSANQARLPGAIDYVEIGSVVTQAENPATDPLPLETMEFPPKNWGAIKYVVMEPLASSRGSAAAGAASLDAIDSTVPGLGMMTDFIQRNPTLSAFFQSLGWTQDNAWPCALNLLVKPSDALLKSTEAYLPFLLDPRAFVIGVQGKFIDHTTTDSSILQLPTVDDRTGEPPTRSQLRRLRLKSPEEQAALIWAQRKQSALVRPFTCAREIAEAFHSGEVPDGFGFWKRPLPNPPEEIAAGMAAKPTPGAANQVFAHQEAKAVKYFFMSNSKLLRNAVVADQAFPRDTLVLNITVEGEVGAVLPPLPAVLTERSLEHWRVTTNGGIFASTWLEFWLFGLTDHQVIPTKGRHAVGLFGKLAGLRSFMQERYGEREYHSHLWDGNGHFHPFCHSRAEALTWDELTVDTEKADRDQLAQEAKINQAMAQAQKQQQVAAEQTSTGGKAAESSTGVQQALTPSVVSPAPVPASPAASSSTGSATPASPSVAP